MTDRSPTTTLVDRLRQRAAELGDTRAYTFLVDGDLVEDGLTWTQLDARARRVAVALRAQGGPAGRAMLVFPPGLDFVVAYFGCLYAGVVAVPVSPPRPSRLAQDLPRLVAQADCVTPQAVLTTAMVAAMGSLLGQAPSLRVPWIAVDTLTDGEDAWIPPDLSHSSPAHIQFTSGSTSAPRGVLLTHGNLVHQQSLLYEAFSSTTTAFLGWLPLTHDMGLIGNVLQPVYCGVPAVLLSPLDFLQRPLRWLSAISRYRASTSGGPNFAYELCVRKVKPEQRDALDLSCWTMAYSGAEPLRAQTMRDFAAYFEPCGFRSGAITPCFGLAETTLVVTGGDLGAFPHTLWVDTAALERHRVVPREVGAPDAVELMSNGRPRGGHEVRIVDPDTREPIADGGVGEIWIRGGSVGVGYWGQPEETERTFRAMLAPDQAGNASSTDGTFLRTGDLGFVDGGELYVTGRLKDLVIARGRNHYPQDVERTIEQGAPAVRAGCVAVFSAVIDGRECVFAAAEVEPSLADASTGERIREQVLAVHDLRLDEVILLEPRTIPKTTSGKLARGACRAAMRDGTLARWRAP